MDPQPRRELATLIAQEGVGLAEDPQRIKAFLMDRCPESRTEMGLLVAAAEDEIPSRLARSSDSIFRDGEIARAVTDLKHTRRLDEGAAEWVVRSWAWALGILDEEPADDLDSGAPPLPFAPEASTGPASISSPAAGHTEPPTTGHSGSYPGSGPEQVWAAPSSPFDRTPYSNTPSSPYGQAGPTSLPPTGPRAQSSPPPWMFDQGPVNTAAAWPGSAGDPGSPTSGWGPPPSQPPNTPPPTGNPPRGSRRTPLAVVGGAVLVVAIVVGAVILTRTNERTNDLVPAASSSSVTPTPTPVLTTPTTVVTTPNTPTTPTSPSEVGFKITATLADWEISETATIYSGGQELGKLKVDRTSTTDYILLQAPPGPANYELDVWMEFTSTTTGEIVDDTLHGRGLVNVYTDASFPITIAPAGNDFIVTLLGQ